MWKSEQVEILVAGEKSSMGVLNPEFYGFHQDRMFTVSTNRQYAKKLLATDAVNDRVFLMYARPNLPPYRIVVQRIEGGVEYKSETRLTDGRSLEVKSKLTPISLQEAKQMASDKIKWMFTSEDWFPIQDRALLEQLLELPNGSIPRN